MTVRFLILMCFRLVYRITTLNSFVSLIGVVPLSPACRRALTTVVDSLRQSGYEVIDL